MQYKIGGGKYFPPVHFTKTGSTKSGIRRPVHFTCLGFGFVPTYRKGERGKYQLVVSAKSWKKLKQKLKTITRKTTPMSFDERIEKLGYEHRQNWNKYKKQIRNSVSFFKMTIMKIFGNILIVATVFAMILSSCEWIISTKEVTPEYIEDTIEVIVYLDSFVFNDAEYMPLIESPDTSFCIAESGNFLHFKSSSILYIKEPMPVSVKYLGGWHNTTPPVEELIEEPRSASTKIVYDTIYVLRPGLLTKN